MKDFFKRLKTQGSRGATPCITGWQLSISAAIASWNDVKSVSGLKYICTTQINQDPLETRFSFIRAKGRFSANPESKQFADVYKLVLIRSCISQSQLWNCESDTNLLLLEVSGTPNKQCTHDISCVTAAIATEGDLGITELANIYVNSLSQKTILCWRVYLQEISFETQLRRLYFIIDMLSTEWFVGLLECVFAAKILQQRIYGEIRSHYFQCSVCVVPQTVWRRFCVSVHGYSA